MKIRKLQVEESQMAQIRVRFQLARVSIETNLRGIKQVDRQAARMKVSREAPSIETDMKNLHNNIGLKDSVTLTRAMASNAVEQMEQAVKSMWREYEYIATLPHDGNPIAQLARQKLLEAPEMPAAGGVVDPTVDVHANLGSLNIDWSIQDVTIVWDDYQEPVIRLDPKPSIDVELVQEPRISFRVVEQSIPPETGRTIDEEA